MDRDGVHGAWLGGQRSRFAHTLACTTARATLTSMSRGEIADMMWPRADGGRWTDFTTVHLYTV